MLEVIQARVKRQTGRTDATLYDIDDDEDMSIGDTNNPKWFPLAWNLAAIDVLNYYKYNRLPEQRYELPCSVVHAANIHFLSQQNIREGR